MIDPRTGTVLAAHDPDERAQIGSTTKMMTALVARAELDPGQRVRAARYDASPGESLIHLRPGETLTARDLLSALLLSSASDAAVTLAEGSAGSVASFVDEMNGAAGRFGLDDTSFANPIGLDDPLNYSTARDLARLAERFRADPLLRAIAATERTRIASGDVPRQLVNHNSLVLSEPFVNGIKTGTTALSGYSLVGSARQRGVELISVVLGAAGEDDRDDATLRLLRYGFSLYDQREVVAAGEPLATTAVQRRNDRLSLLAESQFVATVRRGTRIETAIDAPAEVSAPIAAGQRLGSVNVEIDGHLAGSVALVAAHAVAGANLIDRIDRRLPGGRWLVYTAPAGALCFLGLTLFGALRWRRSPRG